MLEARGFIQSQCDPCLFTSPTVVCLVYVNDCLFFTKDSAETEKITASLCDLSKQDRLVLNVEEDVAGFLGILLHKRDDGTIELLQTGLIDRILRIMGLEECSSKLTLTDSIPLGKDINGTPCCEDLSYSSVVGMMMYLFRLRCNWP